MKLFSDITADNFFTSQMNPFWCEVSLRISSRTQNV